MSLFKIFPAFDKMRGLFISGRHPLYELIRTKYLSTFNFQNKKLIKA